MPKDPAENIDRYKIRGGELNKYEFQQNQEALATDKPETDFNLIPGTPPEQRSKQLIQKTTAPAKKATKTGAKKASKKLTGKKSASKKTSAKKASAKKSVKAKKSPRTSVKKSRAKKAGAKKRSRK